MLFESENPQGHNRLIKQKQVHMRHHSTYPTPAYNVMRADFSICNAQEL